jgi:uncharacterized protein YggE
MTNSPRTVLLLATLAACHDRVIAVPMPGAPGAELDKPGQMAVTGSATLEVSPDCADLTMTITGEAPRPGGATTEVDKKEHAILGALARLGIAGNDVKLSYLTLDTVYEPTPPDHWVAPRLRGYRAQITLTATTHDFAKLGAMMEAGADAGATGMSSQFRRSDLPALKKQVRDLALAAAKDKAAQTARALAIKLGRVVGVSESGASSMWTNGYVPQVANAAEVRPSGDTGAPGGALQPLRLDITVTYELARET